jgi:hypothetical protein
MGFVDQNGDGKDDLACTRTTSSATMYTYRWLSVGDGTFQTQGAFGWLSTSATQKCSVTFGDFNGDGRIDFLCSYYNPANSYFSGTHRVALSLQYGAPVQQAAYASAIGGPAVIRLVDVNGDGRSDLVRSFGTGYATQSFEITSGGAGGLLSRTANGLGGYVDVTYTPSSSWASTYLPAGMVVQTVSKLVASDGRAGTLPITTTFSYAGANWDRIEQRVLGFRTARATDATGAYTETTFTQNVADEVVRVHARSSLPSPF